MLLVIREELVYGRIICFVNCHFAAHFDSINRPNADFDRVYKTMSFSHPSNLLNTSAVLCCHYFSYFACFPPHLIHFGFSLPAHLIFSLINKQLLTQIDPFVDICVCVAFY